jgi:hypothetical protein
MRMPLKCFLGETIAQFDLQEKALNSYVYMEIQ